MWKFYLFIFLEFFHQNYIFGDTLDSLKKCKFGPIFGDCLQESLNTIVPLLKDGDRKYNIEPLEPVSIPYMFYDQNPSGALQVKHEYFNSTVHNFATGTTFTKVKVDLQNHTISLELFNPLIRYEGKYKSQGKVLLFQVEGDGDYYANFYNVTVKLRLKFVETIRDMDTYWQFTKALCYIEPSNLKLHAEDVVKGQKVLSDEINRLVNENWKELWEEFEPSFSKVMAQVFLRFVNRTFYHVAVNKYFTDNYLAN